MASKNPFRDFVRNLRRITISKISDDEGNKTQVKIISESIRVEEIARMLSGASVSDEARAAAVSLLKPGRSADLVR